MRLCEPLRLLESGRPTLAAQCFLRKASLVAVHGVSILYFSVSSERRRELKLEGFGVQVPGHPGDVCLLATDGLERAA